MNINMKTMLSCIIASIVLVSACGASGEEKYSDDHSVTTAPTELLASSKGDLLTIEVSTDAPWQAYASDECSAWASVSPEYCPDFKGTATVKVAENLGKKERSGNIVIKCGTTRHKVALTQEGNVPTEGSIKCPIEGYNLVWHDEFDDSSVQTSNWKFENWSKGWVNDEKQYYVAGGALGNQQTAYIEDGALCIKAQKAENGAKFDGKDISGQVISARMNTKTSWKYAYMEASIWLPKGRGTWPAFWCMPTDQSAGWPGCGEIDIMEEVGNNPNAVSSSIHCQAYNHTKGTQKTHEMKCDGAEEGFHIYAMEWTEDYIKTFVDGKVQLTFPNDGKKDQNTWPFDKAFYITLNLAWGGSWGGSQGVHLEDLPCTMKVDYVRVFQK